MRQTLITWYRIAFLAEGYSEIDATIYAMDKADQDLREMSNHELRVYATQVREGMKATLREALVG